LRCAARAKVACTLLSVCWLCTSCGGSGSASGGPGTDSGPGADGSAAGSPLAPGLWFASTSACEFPAPKLTSARNADPPIVVTASSLPVVNDLALDAKGNAWVVGSGSNDVFRIPAAALTKSGTATADLVIQSAALESPGNLAFDASGSLWVANRPVVGKGAPGDGSILRFDVPGGASGMTTLAPKATITSTKASDLFEIGGMAFDASQNLWVTSFVGLVRFDNPRGQSGPAALAPGAVINKTGFANDIYFYSVAFDASGSLWASSSDGLHYLTSITEFKNPGSLRGRSSPAAAATIQGAMDVLPAGGLAFDVAGNLWMTTGGSVLMYSNPSSLTGSVKTSPAVDIELDVTYAPTTNSHLLFFPPPAIVQDAGPTQDAQGEGAGADATRSTDASDASEVGSVIQTFTFSNVVGSGIDSSPLASPPCCGSTPEAGSDALDAILIVEATDGRTLTCNLSGAFIVGATFTLADTNTDTGTSPSNCTYRQPGDGQSAPQWVSNGGSVTIESMAGPAFTFALRAATMVADPSVASNTASGTFTLDGTGTTTVQ
jgi:hypothetical protein